MIKRLFFDIETSPNIGLFWQCGYKLKIPHENIVQERKMISAAWKWEGEDEVYSISWTRKQDDARVAKKISELINEADEVVTHNGERFDIGWVRGRCLQLGYPMKHRVVSHDTCKLARRYFNLNSYRLDYIASYLGFGHKLQTDFGLWKKVLLDNDQEALDYMVEYNEKDVLLLEEVFNRMKPYIPAQSHATGFIRDCPECGSGRVEINKRRTTAAGHKQVQLRCRDCGKYHTVSERRFDKAK